MLKALMNLIIDCLSYFGYANVDVDVDLLQPSQHISFLDNIIIKVLIDYKSLINSQKHLFKNLNKSISYLK